MVVFDQIGLDIGYVLLGALGVMLILLVLLIVLMVKHNNLKKNYMEFMKGDDGRSLETVIINRFKEVDEIKERLFGINRKLDTIDKFLLQTYNKMAIVKYDAFRELGGNLSFVLVLLNEENDGFIINSMHSTREGCYTYVKKVEKGQCNATLSVEEKQALETAVKSN